MSLIKVNLFFSVKKKEPHNAGAFHALLSANSFQISGQFASENSRFDPKIANVLQVVKTGVL